MRPLNTRLRWVSAKRESTIERFLRSLTFRVEIKQLAWKEKSQEWVLWFVPPDDVSKDVRSGKLKD